VAFIAEKEYLRLEDLVVEGQPAFLVMLDGVEDPQTSGPLSAALKGQELLVLFFRSGIQLA